MLIEEIKRRIMVAMKAGNTVEKEILRLVLGEVQTVEARGTSVTDDGVLGIVRKLVKSNEETGAASTDDAVKAALAAEIAVLQTLLPKSSSVAEIVAALAPVHDAIKAAGNDGQATGVAMKHLKASGVTVNGKDVSEAVKQVRG